MTPQNWIDMGIGLAAGIGLSWIGFSCLWVRLEIRCSRDKGESFYDGHRQGYNQALREHPEFKGKTW